MVGEEGVRLIGRDGGGPRLMGSDFPPEGENNWHVIEIWCSPSVMKEDGSEFCKYNLSESNSVEVRGGEGG